jgi:pseudouridine-5'-phosphate glycosidase
MPLAVADQLVAIAPEVRDALADRRAVVALESTIITHGMPYPANGEMARAVEALIRAEGAVPATVAVMAGRVRVGLDATELDGLAAAQGVAKASRRDLAALLVREAAGGTTVAGTMIAAARAGIAIFATGGIGGVHRGAEQTFDISADLAELARTPVAVVCAGCKSILDIPKTLEVLETHGVPVLGYRTDDFPAFFARSSGEEVDYRFDTPGELAQVIWTQRGLRLETGILIANPIPEPDALPASRWRRGSRLPAGSLGSGRVGKELTPFLLARINELTGGTSLRANIALVKNNAVLAARVAVELARLPARG